MVGLLLTHGARIERSRKVLKMLSSPTQTSNPRLIRFGIFEADLTAGELRKGGSRIRPQEQPFQILAMLLERPGQIITREDLRSKLWPGDTFVDFEHGVNSWG